MTKNRLELKTIVVGFMIAFRWKSFCCTRHTGYTEYTNFDRYIKIRSKTIELSARLWGMTTEFVWFIPQSLVLRFIVLG